MLVVSQTQITPSFKRPWILWGLLWWEVTRLDLSITGKLERDGVKFGIGSSGSVVVLTLKALAAALQKDLSKDILFKLASYTLLKQGDNGSMGDLACIVYEDLISYRSFDRAKIAEL